MKVIVKWKKSILVSLIILMILAIFITVGSKGDEKSKMGYTVYQSSGAITHIDRIDVNVFSPKTYQRFFPDTKIKQLASEMGRRGMAFAVCSPDYTYIQEVYALTDLPDFSEESVTNKIADTQYAYKLTSGMTIDTRTIAGLSFLRVCYSRKDPAFLDYDVVADYFTEKDGVCLEIRSYVEYSDEPDYEKTIDNLCEQTETYLKEYSFGPTQSQPTDGDHLWDRWKSLDFAPWVLLVPLAYALLCGMTFTGLSEKVYDAELKRYRFVGDEGTGWNEDFLSLNISKMLLGVFSVLVMFHHLVQQSGPESAGILAVLEDFGVGFVGAFFFFSGYGLYESVKHKDGYLKGFLKKRLPAVLVPAVVVNLIFLCYRLLQGGRYEAKDIFAWATGWRLLNPQMWYIVEVVLLYILFYLLFRFIRYRRLAIALLFVCVGLMVAGSLMLCHGDHWFQGEWWYNTTFLFAIGVLFSEHRDKLVYFMKRFYALLLPAVLVLFVLFYHWTEYMLHTYSYWSETATDKGYDDKLRCFLVQCPMVIFFVMLLLLAGMKLTIGNSALKYLGTISLEIYLIHNLFFDIFATVKGTGAFFFSVSAATLLAASVLHYINTCILCLIGKKPLPRLRPVTKVVPAYLSKKKADTGIFFARAKRSINYGLRNKKTTGRILFRQIVCVILCLVSVFPVLLLVVNATKTKYDLVRGISFLPGGYFADNYNAVRDYLHTIGLDLYRVVALSCLISVTCTFIGTYIGAMCAYGFEYFEFKRRKGLWWVVLCALMMPAGASCVGFMKLVAALHLYNSLFPIIMAGITIPSCVYFLRMYLQTLSLKEIIEAARIDGCTELTTFNRIILPIMKPAILLQLVINFANSWNNTLYQNLVLIDAKKKSISAFLHSFSVGEGAGSDPFIYCALLVSTIPSLVMFILFSHGITARINLGGIKE